MAVGAQILNQGPTENVPLHLLTSHPSNPNQGDIGAIDESIETIGFYGSTIANKRTGHILAGNHRYQVAKASRWETIPVTWVDVDDKTELRILATDNRTNRLGHDNSVALAALLAELAESTEQLLGTGYDDDDYDRLLSDITREGPFGLDSTKDTQRASGKGTGKSTSTYGKRVVCPFCNSQFEVDRGGASK